MIDYVNRRYRTSHLRDLKESLNRLEMDKDKFGFYSTEELERINDEIIPTLTPDIYLPDLIKYCRLFSKDISNLLDSRKRKFGKLIGK